MKRYIYILLCVIALGLLGYTAYYVMSHQTKTPIVTETPTPVATTTPQVEDKNTYTTRSGKKITLVETNPVGESLSTIMITPEGFATNTPIVLETNKLTNSFYYDLNNDNFEELIITTVAQGSGSFGEVFLYTTASSTRLLPVEIPEMTEDDTKKGALFEGYMGHDSFSIIDGKLVREFPTYTKTDTNNEPTGPRKSIVYSLVEKKGVYSITFIKNTATSSMSLSQTVPGMPTTSSTTVRTTSTTTPASQAVPVIPTSTSSRTTPPPINSGSGSTPPPFPPMPTP